jgi:HSP20 family protein
MKLNESTIARNDTKAAPSPCPEFTPAVDIYETPNAILIRCDMPGVAQEDLEIILADKVLTLTGRQREQDWRTSGSGTCEYQTGVYKRSFDIKRDLDESAVKARLKDGVLEIELPKTAEPGPRRIPVSD